MDREEPSSVYSTMACLKIAGYLTCYAGIKQMDEALLCDAFLAKEHHEFGNHAFDSAVVAVDNACFEELETSAVALHLDTALQALRDIDHDDTFALQLAYQRNEPCLLWSIARAIGLDNHGAQVWCGQEVLYALSANAREEREDEDIVIERVVHNERCIGRGHR